MDNIANVNWIISKDTITVNYNGQTHMVARTDGQADRLIQALKDKRFEEVPCLVSAAERIERFSDGKFTVQNGDIYVDGEVAPPILGSKIKEFADNDLPYQPLIKFLQRLRKNPSQRALNDLYSFLEKNHQPITDDGCFIAYKKVREDFTDVHTGTFHNHPTNVLEMPREEVDDDPNSHCSHGFHVGNWRYCNTFYSNQGIMLEVKVDPADVVSIPYDLNEKIRVCKYEVLGVVDKELSDPYRDTSKETDELDEDEETDVCEACGEEYDIYNGCPCSEDVCDCCMEPVDDCVCDETCCEEGDNVCEEEVMCSECGEEYDGVSCGCDDGLNDDEYCDDCDELIENCECEIPF